LCCPALIEDTQLPRPYRQQFAFLETMMAEALERQRHSITSWLSSRSSSSWATGPSVSARRSVTAMPSVPGA
jgi:hypothetical protein